MKNILIFLFLAFSCTACGWFNFNTDMNTTVGFTFVDTNGKDIFADSLSVEDFQIRSIEGYARLHNVDTIYGNHYFSIGFGEGRDGDEKSVTLVQIKDDIDTIKVTFKNDYHSLKNLYYNDEHFKMEEKTGNYLIIEK